MTDPQTTCHTCGSLLMLTPSGAVCSRDHKCGGLRTGVDRAAISQAWNFQRDQQFVLALPAAIQDSYDRSLEPLYRLDGKPGKWWRAMNVCEADSGLAKSYVPKLPYGSVLGRLKIHNVWWVCVFTDGKDTDEETVPFEIRQRVANAHEVAKTLFESDSDLS